MIARTQHQPPRPTLSSQSGADSRVAVIELRENRRTDECCRTDEYLRTEEHCGTGEYRSADEQRPAADDKLSWGYFTSVPASGIARRRRPERRPASPVKLAITRSGPVTTPRDRVALGGCNALAQQTTSRERMTRSHLQMVEAYRRHAMRAHGLSHLLCGLCRQNEVAPFFVQGVRLLPAVRDVPHGAHGVVRARPRAVEGAQALRAVPVVSGQAAGCVRLMGARFVVAGAGRFGMQGRVGNASARVAITRPGGARARTRLGGSAATCIPASCGRVGCPRAMCVRVFPGSARP